MERVLFENGMPVDSLFLLTENQFFYADQLMAMSLFQGGPLPNLLSECCYKIISLPTCVNPTDIERSKEFLNFEKIRKVSIYIVHCIVIPYRCGEFDELREKKKFYCKEGSCCIEKPASVK